MCDDRIVDLYERHARTFDRDRGRSLIEKTWLDAFSDLLPARATVLDIGCGSGEPIARYLIDAGCSVVGVDSSPTMIAMCRERFHEHEWIVADMRRLALGRRLDGVIAWDSFFHLSRPDQRAMFPRFAAHAKRGAPLLFTSGSRDGEAIGVFQGEPLYHASLGRAEYEQLLADNHFAVVAYRADDRKCGRHTVWLGKRLRAGEATEGAARNGRY